MTSEIGSQKDDVTQGGADGPPGVPSPVEVAFYHLEQASLESTLAKLLAKALAAGFRVVVRGRSDERIESLNAALWTVDPASFLPHGSIRDGNAESQPIWLTAGDDNPNGASVLILVDGAEAGDLSPYSRCLEIFDGNDETALKDARRHWAAHRSAGRLPTYWRQGPQGGWQRQNLAD